MSHGLKWIEHFNTLTTKISKPYHVFKQLMLKKKLYYNKLHAVQQIKTISTNHKSHRIISS